MDEISGPELCVVAQHGRRFGVCCEKMSYMSVQSSYPSNSAVISMGVAEPTVDETACGLLQACNGEDDTGSRRCPL